MPSAATSARPAKLRHQGRAGRQDAYHAAAGGRGRRVERGSMPTIGTRLNSERADGGRRGGVARDDDRRTGRVDREAGDRQGAHANLGVQFRVRTWPESAT